MANWRMSLAILTVAVPATAMAIPVGARVVRREKWGDYWARFTHAALISDASGIAAATAPIALQRGALDSDAVVKLPRAQVPAIVARLLRSPEPIDASRRTLRRAFQGPAPAHDTNQPLGFRRAGPLVFEQRQGRWFLTEIYVEE